jgi:hypothetical protein
MLLIIIALTFTCCDVNIGGVRVWHSPAGQIADALYELRTGESRVGRRHRD